MQACTENTYMYVGEGCLPKRMVVAERKDKG